MKRTAGALVILAAVGGCVTVDQGPSANSGCGIYGWTSGPPQVPGAQGPWGQPVAMTAPYSASPPNGADAARAMMARSVPVDLVQTAAASGAGTSSGIIRAGGTPLGAGGISPLGVPFQPIVQAGFPPGAVAAVGALTGPSAHPFPTKRTEVRFVGPEKMQVSWNGTTPDGRPAQGYVTAPGRYNFVQGALYRLKLSNIPSLPGVELYPTLEVVPANARTEAFLAHSAVPVVFTNEDFEQVQAGNYLVKVIYLPNPQYQELAAVGPEEIISSRLEPGADPIAVARQRGSILLVVRLGNINLELPNSPPMQAPSPFGPTRCMVPSMPRSGLIPGMLMPPMMGGGQSMPGDAMMNGTSTQAIPTIVGGGPGMPIMGQTIPLSQLPNSSAAIMALPKDSSAGPVIDSTQTADQVTTEIPVEEKPPAKHHWWQLGGSAK
jgi:hypothetical protein